jgi:hypothetical protein
MHVSLCVVPHRASTGIVPLPPDAQLRVRFLLLTALCHMKKYDRADTEFRILGECAWFVCSVWHLHEHVVFFNFCNPSCLLCLSTL